jgi:hypothetical protein
MRSPFITRAATLVSTTLFLAVIPAFSQAITPTTAPTATPTPVAATPTPATDSNSVSLKSVQWNWSGYVQGRFSDTIARPKVSGFGGNNTVSPSDFSIERAYLYLDAVVNPHVDAVVNLELAPNPLISSPYLLEGYGQYTFDKNAKLKARIGFSRLPYGYEATLTSANLITLERSQAQFSMLYGDYSFDRGLFAYYKPHKYGVNLAAAVTNGTTMFPQTQPVFPATNPTYFSDPDGNKNVVARAGYAFTGGELGASIYSGTSPLSGETMNRGGYDLQYANKGFTLLSEGIWGRDNTTNETGIYATLAYQQPGMKGQPYLRFDTFDPDDSVNNNLYSRLTAGFNYYLTPKTKLTAELQAIDNKAATAGVNSLLDAAPLGNSGKVLIQYQIIF